MLKKKCLHDRTDLMTPTMHSIFTKARTNAQEAILELQATKALLAERNEELGKTRAEYAT